MGAERQQMVLRLCKHITHILLLHNASHHPRWHSHVPVCRSRRQLTRRDLTLPPSIAPTHRAGNAVARRAVELAGRHRAARDTDLLFAECIRPPARLERDLHGRPVARGRPRQQYVHLVPAGLLDRLADDRSCGRVERGFGGWYVYIVRFETLTVGYGLTVDLYRYVYRCIRHLVRSRGWNARRVVNHSQ